MSFLALYRGDSVPTAQLVTVCADPELVARFARKMLHNPDHELTRPTGDPAVDALRGGHRQALELVREEAEGEASQDSRDDGP